jgi:F420-dependent oxidoreductase-like protein
MKIGLQVPNFTWPGGSVGIASKLAEIATAADEGNFASLWVMDHFFQIGGRNPQSNLGPAEDDMLEGYSVLSYLAGITKNVKLGTLVTGVVYRHPGVLAKTVTTLDVISNGRAYLGIGAAWNEREAFGLGIPFPPVAERFERLEEALQIVLQMWSGKRTPYQGKHYELAETLNSPQPLTRPHPPILIGGSGERKTLRLVAQYADECNLFAGAGNDVVSHKLDVLKLHCDRLGRDCTTIEKTTLGTAGWPQVI